MKKKEENSYQKSFSLKTRFVYWFNNRMEKDSLGLIRMLIVGCFLLAVFMGVLIICFGFFEGEPAAAIWDSIATVLNAWMPSFEDGSPGYLILMSITAIAGVLFTSVLIGFITSTIEERIADLKKGNSLVLEKGHYVVLGFYPGEYTLLHQLILAAAGKPACVVIAEDMAREDMEQCIQENLSVPKNFRIVCRTADITDPASLEKCSLETCKTIIISPTEDMRTIKAILAASVLLNEKGASGIRVNAIISKNEYRFPPSLAAANNITTLQTNIILACIIAHSCTQTGLSETFREVFKFEGSEFYLVSLPITDGMTFEEVMDRLENGVPAGILRENRIMLNPPAGFALLASDRVLVFAEESDSARLGPGPAEPLPDTPETPPAAEETTEAVIIGHNETMPVILNELPKNVSHVYCCGHQTAAEERNALQKIASKRNFLLHFLPGDPHSEKVLITLAETAKHIVILNDHDKDPEEADMETMFVLLNLRDIRNRYGLSFNITVEMRMEHNQKLVGQGDHTDFLVASSMSSLILTQLAESPELIGVFKEILSNGGNELYLKNAGLLNLKGSYSIRDLRRIMLKRGCILLGYLDADKNSFFNLPLKETITLAEEDHLIVLGEN